MNSGETRNADHMVFCEASNRLIDIGTSNRVAQGQGRDKVNERPNRYVPPRSLNRNLECPPSLDRRRTTNHGRTDRQVDCSKLTINFWATVELSFPACHVELAGD